MQFLCAIGFLASITGMVLALQPNNDLDAVMAELRRVLTPEELNSYRGLTMAGMTGTKYEKLFGIQSAAELISAERYGAYRIPSDDPENTYFFSSGRGLTATMNPEYSKAVAEIHGFGVVSNQTLAEIDADYRNATLPGTAEARDEELEQLLASVAEAYISWVQNSFGYASGLSPRANYYCKNNGQYCYNYENCARIRTFRYSQCVCGPYSTCLTEVDPLPPYHCQIGVQCIN